MRAVILDGIVLGLQFGLLGVGLTLVYGLGGILNLAQGQIAVLGAIVVALLIDDGRSAGVAGARGDRRRRRCGRPPRPHPDAARLPRSTASSGCCSGCC